MWHRDGFSVEQETRGFTTESLKVIKVTVSYVRLSGFRWLFTTAVLCGLRCCVYVHAHCD